MVSRAGTIGLLVRWPKVSKTEEIQAIIDDEPWACTVHRPGATPDDDESTFEFTGRIVPAGTRAVAFERGVPYLSGEQSVSRYSYAVLAPAGTPRLEARDTLIAINGTVTRKFRIIQGMEFTYKVEAVLDELQ